MSVQSQVRKWVSQFSPGNVFSYRELPLYAEAPEAVVKAVSRMAQEGELRRLSKGNFYRPKRGLLGEQKPSDSEKLKILLLRAGRRVGYVTGAQLYNRLGLTTQVPKTVTVALTGTRQKKDLGTLRVKLVPSRAPISEQTIPLLELLDALKDIRRIPGATPSSALALLGKRVQKLDSDPRTQLCQLAINYYPSTTRALLGLLLDTLQLVESKELKASLNPLSRYKTGLDVEKWPKVRDWKIQ